MLDLVFDLNGNATIGSAPEDEAMADLGGPAGYGEFEKRTLLAGTQTLLRGLSLLEFVASGVTDFKKPTANLKAPTRSATRMFHHPVAKAFFHHIAYTRHSTGVRLIAPGAHNALDGGHCAAISQGKFGKNVQHHSCGSRVEKPAWVN